ncbi:TIGR02679 family protein [Nocardia sp. AG03]|uniref:TIGR02679 family protein n=1 Tax=Nocardia sp. AG03 TaxID=3025312 RepID=UPI002418B603|nr:TIGR02679 family protein [Nocardia sp. AG03]
MPTSSVADLSTQLMPLWRALHERFSTGRPVASIRIGPLSDLEREAIADLFGSPSLPREHHTVKLGELDSVLAGTVGAGAREVVEQLVGPIGDRRADRAARVRARAQLWDWLRSHPVVLAQPALTEWVTGAERSGLVGQSVPRTRGLLEQAVAVLAALPAAGVPVPVLAESTVGDTHALDEGTRLHSLVMRALAEIHQCPMPSDAVGVRRLWELAGVADDELSPTVLVAGLGGVGAGTVLGEVLRVTAEAAMAAAVTLQQVRAVRVLDGVPEMVYVVENPSVLAVAVRRFGVRCPPMVCTAGWPNSAGVGLLELLGAGGAELRYHGDFDGEGLRIAAHLMARVAVRPWRMSREDYLSVAGSGPAVGRVTEAPWDPGLATELRRVGKVVSQERVIEQLMADLA